MRTVERAQFRLGQLRIEDIKLDAKSRDDIPAILKGLQHIYRNEETRAELFELRHIRPGIDRSVGRPGMEMWKILVLGVAGIGVRSDSRACESAQDSSSDDGAQRFCRRYLLRVSDGY